MAATTTFELTMGERLRLVRTRQRRELKEVAAEAQALLPASLSMSHELVRRLEVGLIPEEKVNPVHLAALAHVYGVSVSDISPAAAEALNEVRGLLARSSPWITAEGLAELLDGGPVLLEPQAA